MYSVYNGVFSFKNIVNTWDNLSNVMLVDGHSSGHLRHDWKNKVMVVYNIVHKFSVTP